MISKKLIKRTFLIGPILGAMIAAAVLIGCMGDSNPTAGPGSSGATASQSAAGGEAPGEHPAGGEVAGGEGGGESGGGAAGSEEASAANLAPDETFDAVRSGARLIMNYDPASNSFQGTVENTTGNVLTRVRIEVHLSNGTELGPTAPIDLAPGEVAPVNLPSTAGSFATWIAHAEVGSGSEGGPSGGESGGSESGPDGPEGPESGGASNEAAMEAAMSSPIIPLGQTWNGVLGGLAVDARYDAATQSVESTVQNTLAQKQCYVQAEPTLEVGNADGGRAGPGRAGRP